MTAVWASDAEMGWRVLEPTRYAAEHTLHELVERNPALLPLAGSPRLTVLGREVRLGPGRVDLLAVEWSGRLVLIEVKLSSNEEARRAVVAQVLSYAGYLQGLDPDYLQSMVLGGHLAERGVTTVFDAVRADDQAGVLDADSFNDGVAKSLGDGGFRLVIVLDAVPDELAQVVGYLESLTDKVLIDLVEIQQYDVGGTAVLVPQRVEPARRVRELSEAEAKARDAAALYPGSAEFGAAIAAAPPEQRPFLTSMTEWAETVAKAGGVSLVTYRGKNSITTLLPRLKSTESGLVTIYQEPSAAYLQLWPSVFDRCAPGSRERVERALGEPIQAGRRFRDVSDDLLAALTQAYREATGRPPTVTGTVSVADQPG